MTLRTALRLLLAVKVAVWKVQKRIGNRPSSTTDSKPTRKTLGSIRAFPFFLPCHPFPRIVMNLGKYHKF
ncbi:hypothetical protein C1H46_013767 [Malus baccata]|uniref:Secreted protein n=1 Tax=Malus baccata TaxID=106549 RepID=A0A540MQJ6_MALBA|nr:hypothetical protein C1H46_013767 [Malus baccata]